MEIARIFRDGTIEAGCVARILCLIQQSTRVSYGRFMREATHPRQRHCWYGGVRPGRHEEIVAVLFAPALSGAGDRFFTRDPTHTAPCEAARAVDDRAVET